MAAIDVYEDGEAGLLLCYNCKLLKLTALFLGNLKEARPRFTWCLVPMTLITLQGASKMAFRAGSPSPPGKMGLPVALSPGYGVLTVASI